ncbi:hypothetical protein [Hydrogenophaga sp. 2FB]|uniref:hypothetical protein n=1 Tax=Hydrogenophaga sp. 2FB TaxID=2502187 RepID=UPI0010F74A28|nr:hypothetical protein [Hydrogenophaga sp. 2FB]
MKLNANSENVHEQELQEIAAMIRRIYLSVLKDAIGRAETNGACFYACVLLHQAIEKFSSMAATIRGGDGLSDGGYFDPWGRGFGHYWVEARLDSGSAWVIDITADQFGGPDVLVAPLAGSQITYRPGDQSKVDEHISEHGTFTGTDFQS